MQTITTTELRTKSKELVDSLLAGKIVSIIHRSHVIGEIRPKELKPKIFNAEKAKKILDQLNFKPYSPKEAEKRYREYLMKRYGKSLSGHKQSS